jgi:AcrR family transcriptional regulator
MRPPNPQLVDRILVVTTDMIAESGPRAVTLRAVASEVGVTATTIAYYFAGKKGLFDAAKMRAMIRLDDAVAACEQDGAGTAARMRALVGALVAWSLANPHAFSLLFESRPPSPDVVDEATVGLDAVVRRLQRVLEEGQARGEVSPEAPEEAAAMCFAAVVGIVHLFLGERLPPPFRDDPSALIERFMSVFLGSLHAGRATDPPSEQPASPGGGAVRPSSLTTLRAATGALGDDEIDGLAAAGPSRDAGGFPDGLEIPR